MEEQKHNEEGGKQRTNTRHTNSKYIQIPRSDTGLQDEI